ncbi:hypothetical protein CR513_42321, partial [Mucuna pruriens]
MGPEPTRPIELNRREASNHRMPRAAIPTEDESTFDKRVKPRVFKEGDLVLKKRLRNIQDSRGKWAPNYEGPYVVKQAFSGGAVILANSKGQELTHPERTRRINLQVSRTEEPVPTNAKKNRYERCIGPSQNPKTLLPWVKLVKPRLKLGSPRQERQPSPQGHCKLERRAADRAIHMHMKRDERHPCTHA